MDKQKQIAVLERRLQVAERRAEKAAASRRNLGLGASRARITTANARWAAAAEERDRIYEQLQKARAGMPSQEGIAWGNYNGEA